MSKELLQQSEQLGRECCQRGGRAVPVLDQKLQNFLAGFARGQLDYEVILKAWHRGWHAEINREIEGIRQSVIDGTFS